MHSLMSKLWKKNDFDVLANKQNVKFLMSLRFPSLQLIHSKSFVGVKNGYLEINV